MTEIGRKIALLTGASTALVTVFTGLASGANPALLAVQSLLGGLIFGCAGLFIGNLLDSFVTDAALTEAQQTLVRRELARKMARERTDAPRDSNDDAKAS